MLSRRLFAQVLCDFSFQTAALSAPANPGYNDPDEQKTGDDGQNNEQIKIFFRHCPAFRPLAVYGGYFRRRLILAITSMSKNPATLDRARRK
jgi:hypothetical protein